MAIWDKFKGGASGEGSGKGGHFKPDPRKARRFFEHAETTADSGNYDYSIECYISGLRHDPELMSKHEALYEVAKRRKVKGGKPAGMVEKRKSLGPRAIDKMLLAEKNWAKDILNVHAIYAFMKAATEADEAEQQMNFSEIVYWIGSLLLDANSQQKHPKKKVFTDAIDLLERVEAYDKAIEACRRAAVMDPNDTDLRQRLKELEASNAMQKGGYNRTTAEEGGFQGLVRDSDKQRELAQEDAVSKTESTKDEIIARHRAAFEEDPQDTDRMNKLVNALLQKEDGVHEDEAIALLLEAWEETGSYRYKLQVGDIKIKQTNRLYRAMLAKRKQNPEDDALKQQFDQLRKKKLTFELDEYADRIKNYPTDLSLRFDYGLRLYLTNQIDEAIAAFQQAKDDPKRRSPAYEYLGRCYLHKDWLDEALDTLREGVEKHPLRDDKQGLDLQYQLMNALEKAATKHNSFDQANEAREVGSAILQSNINYRDIRQRVEKIRALVDQLRS